MEKDAQMGNGDMFVFEETEGGLAVRLRDPSPEEGGWRARKYGLLSPERAEIPSHHSGKPVVEVAERAFADAKRLREVYVPDTVERIGAQAFAHCANLREVSGMDGVRRIGRLAFEDCSSLETFRLPVGLEDIGRFAFSGCLALVDVTNLSAIPAEAVRGAFGGEAPPVLNVHSGESGAGRFFTDASGFRFYDGGGALPVLIGWDGERMDLRLPDSCGGRPYLVSGGIFKDDEITESVYVPSGAAGFGLEAFSGCWSLKKVEAESLSSWCATDFEDSFANPLRSNAPLYVGGERVVDLDVPYGTERIGRFAFADACFRFVTIPDTVKSFGKCAFLNCGPVDGLRLGSVASWCAAAFEDEYSNPLPVAERVSFDGVDAKNLRIPEGVETIPPYAFFGCRRVESVTLPESLREIGYDAFSGCVNLTRVTNLSPLDIRPGDEGHGRVAEHAAEVVTG